MGILNILQQFQNTAINANSVSIKNTEEEFLFETEIAGLKYNDLNNIYHHLHPGTTLRLVREFNNAFDTNATAIYYQNFKLGYIPRAYNISLSRMLERGFSLHTTIQGIQKQKFLPAERILIKITDQIA